MRLPTLPVRIVAMAALILPNLVNGIARITVPTEAPFDRGLFSLSVHGKLLQWAFMPPYLNTLNYSERELRARSGWRLTREAILAMQHTSTGAGAQFLVMFLPSKSQVYWPLLEASLGRDDLQRALSFYLEGNGRRTDVDAMRRNRLAQNTMLRELCESAADQRMTLKAKIRRIWAMTTETTDTAEYFRNF